MSLPRGLLNLFKMRFCNGNVVDLDFYYFCFFIEKEGNM